MDKNILKKYKLIKTREDKRLFCLKLDEQKNKTFNKMLSYEKLSEFSINVCFEKLTGFIVNEKRKERIVNYKEHKKF